MNAPEEKDILIAKFFSGEASPEEAMALADWISESPLHAEHYEAARQVFGQDDFKEVQVVWQLVKDKMAPRPTKWFQWSIAAAAMVILGLSIAWWLYHPVTKSVPPVAYIASADPKTIALPDGSKVRLMAAGRLKVLGKRHFYFSGSGEFIIKHRSIDPVVIDMDRFFVKDLGTRFLITTSADQDTISIQVKEGKVLLYDVNQVQMTVDAGKKARYIRSVQRLENFEIVDDKTVVASPVVKKKSKPIGAVRRSSDSKTQAVKPILPILKVVKPIAADTNETKPIQ